MEQYGAAFAQSGTPVDRASDYQRTLDTRWKTVSLVASAPIFVPSIFGSGQASVKILDHNLGYLPAFDAPFFNTRFEVQSSAASTYVFVADRKSVWLVNDVSGFSGGSIPYTIEGYVNVYDINLEEDYESMPKGVPSGSVKTRHGIKLVGNNQYAAKNVQDEQAIGFSLTTDAKALGIYKVEGVEVPGSPGFGSFASVSIPHDLGYPPLIKISDLNPLDAGFFQFALPAGSSGPFIGAQTLSNIGGNMFVTAKTNEVVLTTGGTSTKNYRYVLYREPTELAR